MTGEGKASETRSETRLPFSSILRLHFNIHKHPALPRLLPAEPASPALGLPRNPGQTLGPSAGERIISPPLFFVKYVFYSSNWTGLSPSQGKHTWGSLTLQTPSAVSGALLPTQPLPGPFIGEGAAGVGGVGPLPHQTTEQPPWRRRTQRGGAGRWCRGSRGTRQSPVPQQDSSPAWS